MWLDVHEEGVRSVGEADLGSKGSTYVAGCPQGRWVP
jgi:hypothetical protein